MAAARAASSLAGSFLSPWARTTTPTINTRQMPGKSNRFMRRPPLLVVHLLPAEHKLSDRHTGCNGALAKPSASGTMPALMRERLKKWWPVLKRWWPVFKAVLVIAILIGIGRVFARDLLNPDLWSGTL